MTPIKTLRLLQYLRVTRDWSRQWVHRSRHCHRYQLNGICRHQTVRPECTYRRAPIWSLQSATTLKIKKMSTRLNCRLKETYHETWSSKLACCKPRASRWSSCTQWRTTRTIVTSVAIIISIREMSHRMALLGASCCTTTRFNSLRKFLQRASPSSQPTVRRALSSLTRL